MLKRIWDEKMSKAFRGKLLSWYRKNRRRLPWRDDPSPYKVWISEIMLQQTQTASVLRYYERFLNRFPDIESLAQAHEAEVLKSWSGLGYYSRARNLHAAAIKIMETGNTFPNDFQSIIALPGVGRYTAGAICSIAFNQPYPVVDGNVRRVISRLHGLIVRTPEQYFWDKMAGWIPEKSPSDFNQGMMELGAVVCLPIQPRCVNCPVRLFCRAKRLGIQTKIPGVHKKKIWAKLQIAILVLERNGRILLSCSGGPGLIPGDWMLPWKIVKDGETMEQIAADLCREAVGKELRLEPGRPVRHTISNHQISALGFFGSVKPGDARKRAARDHRWAFRSPAEKLLTSSLFRKVLQSTH